jgi:hypothetical protein
MVLAVVLWCVLQTAALVLPAWTGSPKVEDDLARNTVRPALLYYALAASLMLLLHASDWDTSTPRGRLARCLWTLAWAAYLVHVAVALAVYHHGSHAEAVEHTRRRSGFGEGIYVSHLFTLLWSADVLAWWMWPSAYARRPAWVGRLLHGFLFFIVFNATVVFETGLIRWAGVALTAGLALLWLVRPRSVHRTTR